MTYSITKKGFVNYKKNVVISIFRGRSYFKFVGVLKKSFFFIVKVLETYVRVLLGKA